jgi:post-segregation antitoxin (ccd killing protein)
MSTLTIKEHVERAAAFVGLIKKHEADLSAIGSDIPKAISIAEDFHELFKAQDVKVSVAAAQATAPAPASKPAAAPAAPRVTAAHAAQHITEHGLSDSERAAFERASQSVG